VVEINTLNNKIQFIVFVAGGTCSYPLVLNDLACGISKYVPGVVIAVRCGWYGTLVHKEGWLFLM